MKKLICGLAMCSFALVLAGCGKGDKLTCTIEADGMTNEETFTFKDSKVSKYESSMVFESEEYAEAMYGIAKLDSEANVKKDGKKVTLVVDEETIEEQYGDQTKEDIKKAFEEQGYTCK